MIGAFITGVPYPQPWDSKLVVIRTSGFVIAERDVNWVRFTDVSHLFSFSLLLISISLFDYFMRF